jgi:hypothetical protein
MSAFSQATIEDAAQACGLLHVDIESTDAGDITITTSCPRSVHQLAWYRRAREFAEWLDAYCPVCLSVRLVWI